MTCVLIVKQSLIFQNSWSTIYLEAAFHPRQYLQAHFCPRTYLDGDLRPRKYLDTKFPSAKITYLTTNWLQCGKFSRKYVLTLTSVQKILKEIVVNAKFYPHRKWSMAQMKDQVITIKTHTESSTLELSSGSFGHLKVWPQNAKHLTSNI